MWDGANQWVDGRCWSNRRLVFVLTCLLWFPPRRAPEPGPQSVGRYPCRQRSPQIVFPWAAWATVPLQVLPAVCGSHQWVKVLPSIPGADYNTLQIKLLHFQLWHYTKIPLVFLWLSGSESWGQKFHWGIPYCPLLAPLGGFWGVPGQTRTIFFVFWVCRSRTTKNESVKETNFGHFTTIATVLSHDHAHS